MLDFIDEKVMSKWTGYERPAWQIKWLKNHEIPFTIGGDKKPKVAEQVYYQLFGLKGGKKPREPKLNLAAFNR